MMLKSKNPPLHWLKLGMRQKRFDLTIKNSRLEQELSHEKQTSGLKVTEEIIEC